MSQSQLELYNDPKDGQPEPPVDPSATRVGLIATIPRSGTFYQQYFWSSYEALLNGATRVNPYAPYFRKFPAIGLDVFSVCHAYCPCFLEIYHGPHRDSWLQLTSLIVDLDWGTDTLKKYNGAFYPTENRQVRIAFVYRNPFDQLLSYYRQMTNPGNEYLRTIKDQKSGEEFTITTLSDFIRRTGMNSYIKTYFTYYTMKDVFPANIRFFSYEDIFGAPEQTFKKMAAFFDHSIETEERSHAFQKAVAFTSTENMKKLETGWGGSLADPEHKKAKHIQDGVVGSWESKISEEDRRYCEERLAAFGIDLDFFNLGSTA